MREIKFRAVLDGKIIEWDKVQLACTYDSFSEHYEETDKNEIAVWIDDSDENISKASLDTDIPLLQYTGLKDKNDVEIYEGDIVEWIPFGLCEVRYYRNSFVLWSKHGDFSRHYLTDDVQIIGNIYETPELLETK